MRSSICATYPESVWSAVTVGASITPYHLHNSVNLPRHLLHSTLHLLLGGDGLGHLYIHYTTVVITVPLAWSNLNNGMSLIMSYPIVYHKLLLTIPKDKQFHKLRPQCPPTCTFLQLLFYLPWFGLYSAKYYIRECVSLQHAAICIKQFVIIDHWTRGPLQTRCNCFKLA